MIDKIESVTQTYIMLALSGSDILVSKLKSNIDASLSVFLAADEEGLKLGKNQLP